MKNKIIFITLLYVVFGFSQNKKITLNWDGVKSLYTDSYALNIPYFTNKDAFVYSLDEGVVFVQQWNSNGAIDPNSLVVSSVSYENITLEELKDIDISLLN